MFLENYYTFYHHIIHPFLTNIYYGVILQLLLFYVFFSEKILQLCSLTRDQPPY